MCVRGKGKRGGFDAPTCLAHARATIVSGPSHVRHQPICARDAREHRGRTARPGPETPRVWVPQPRFGARHRESLVRSYCFCTRGRESTLAAGVDACLARV